MSVTICDVGPRDGLQNEDRILDPSSRAELCDRLAAAGLKKIEAASFVNPKLVPQMAGAEEVMGALHRRPGTVYAGLALNEMGYERAILAGVDEVHYAFAATDEFGRRNQNATTEEGIRTALALVARARADRVPVTITISVAFGCPFEGPVPARRVLEIVERLMAAPADEICLADTIGVGVPVQVKELVGGARELGATVGAHFHNTRNTGYANALAALEQGAVSLDASVGGAGGCPFAPRATGNIATEDLVYLLRGMGVETGVDMDALIATSQWLAQKLDKQLPGMVARAGDYPWHAQTPVPASSVGMGIQQELIDALRESSAWRSSVYVHTYDESGGFFDHVSSPQLDAYGLGVRVPTQITSPFARPRHLEGALYEHSSVLKFIEAVFDLPTLASVNHQFDASTPGGGNNEAAKGQVVGPPAPPRDGSRAIGNLMECFAF